jgi:two-component system heavy metal sensor histidine kinase CusS
MSSKNGRNESSVESQAGRPARHWSIARRLALLYASTSLLMLILAATYLYWSLVGDVERDDNAFLANKIQECRRLLSEGPRDRPLLAHEIQTEATASEFIKYFVRLLDERGQIELETSGMSNLLPTGSFPAPIAAEQAPKRGLVKQLASGASYSLMAAKASATGEGSHSRTLQVALEVTSDEALISGYRWKLLLVVLLGMLFSGVAGILVARRGLRPLKAITDATERITASQLHERMVANGWPEELDCLARSFDRMLDRLEDSFQRLSRFSADLAHELRTPVNNLRGEAGVALSQARTAEEYRHTLESSLEEYARLTRLIDNMLFLARADGPSTSIVRAPCDARKAIELVREYYEALAEDRGVEVRCEGDGVVNVEPVLFRQAVSNLLSNALNYTPRGGQVHITIRDRDDRGREVCVSDTGCGIPVEHLPRVFDRLYRVDPSRSQHPNGAGLGLAIVKSIMTLHGGSVTARSEIGKGTSFTLIFPSTPSAATITKTGKQTKM